MNKLVIFTTVFVLILVFVVPGVLALPIKVVPFNDQPGYSTDYKRGVYGKKVIWQEFTSQEDRLTGIGLSIGNPNLKNKKEVILNLYQGKISQDSDLGKPIRQSILNGQNISDGAFVRFLFDPIANSKNQKYLISLASPDAGDEEVINIFFTNLKPDWIGELRHDQEVLAGAMPLVTFHKPQNRSSVIKSVYFDWLKRIVGIN